jgi:hypothetical protein
LSMTLALTLPRDLSGAGVFVRIRCLFHWLSPPLDPPRTPLLTWPAHHRGGTEKVPSTIKLLRILKSVEHLDFTQSTVKEEVTKGWTSAAFDEPLPWMAVSPLFVIRVKKHHPWVVGDHTASGLNDGIKCEDVPATYDTVVDLIHLMRHHKVVTGKADKGVL